VQISWASSGVEGLAAARLIDFDLIFVELELPDMSGMDVVKLLRAERPGTRVVIVTRWATASLARHARQGGVMAVLERPVNANALTALVCDALSLGQSRPYDPGGPTGVPTGVSTPAANGLQAATPSTPGSMAERWAWLVFKTIHADTDPKTLGSWARAIGVSRSALCECCRLVHLTPHDARDFARLTRAVYRSGQKWQPETVLDLADARTLRKLLARAGLALNLTLTPTLDEFFGSQDWIPAGNPGLCALRVIISSGHDALSEKLTLEEQLTP
jgi:CheY-like chemotaxis protein